MSGKPPTIGFVTALEMERDWIGAESVAEVGGMGRARAEAAAGRLLDRGAGALVSWGIAGGLDPDLGPGTVVIPEFVVDGDQGRWFVDSGWRDRLLTGIGGLVPISRRPMYHSDRIVASPEQKHALHERWSVAAVDMESAGIAKVARGAGVPWLIIRVVGDVADQGIPKAVTELSDRNGRLRYGAVAGLVLRPRLWPTLLALGRANAAAGRSMRRVWTAVEPDLVLGEGRNR